MIQNRKKQIESKEPVKTDRRKFLAGLWKWLGLVALGELAFFLVSMLRPGRDRSRNLPVSLKTIGNVEDFSRNTVTTDRINKILLVRMEDGGFLALSLICSHLGCSVIWDDLKKQFNCPCHSSAFDRVGNVINSPATRALDYFPVVIEAGKVKIDVSQKRKRRSFEKNQLTYAV